MAVLWMVPLLLAVAVAVAGQTPNPREIVREAFTRDQDVFSAVHDYTYTERQITKRLDKKGRVTDFKDETNEVLYLYGRPFDHLVARNGKPLPPDEAAKEKRKVDKESEKRRRNPGSGDEERQRFRKTAREVPDAFTFRMLGEEDVHGERAWLIEAKPRKDYRAQTKEAKNYRSISARLWIDQKERVLSRAEVVVEDTISFGLFLFRLQPGARIEIDRTRLEQNVWLPRHVFIKGDGKLLGLKTLRIEVDASYSDYKKFQTDSRIVAAGEPE
jgi:hypothetical protein